ncbi:hypothetical protein [Paenibacillus donghaensis]|uniref:Uncharacterized protein n=1 Tax=Paenibacillus donghaensis TaxID=414771 RepID=A0A2Z2KPY1_9BACL|nr:hypothetical protein [Paenibacillus donghaensis]ASA20868.1 hypothetical protein B9T62_08785 [Paenibacillus donghaensis]
MSYSQKLSPSLISDILHLEQSLQAAKQRLTESRKLISSYELRLAELASPQGDETAEQEDLLTQTSIQQALCTAAEQEIAELDAELDRLEE